jgi:hypothetical protein
MPPSPSAHERGLFVLLAIAFLVSTGGILSFRIGGPTPSQAVQGGWTHAYDGGAENAATRLAVGSTPTAASRRGEARLSVLDRVLLRRVALVVAAELGAVADLAPAFARSQCGGVPSVGRAAALERAPTCPYCGEAPSTQVDHITALKQDWQSGGWADDFATRTARVNDPENLIGACQVCNAAKGARPIGTGPGEWWPPAWSPDAWWPFGGP